MKLIGKMKIFVICLILLVVLMPAMQVFATGVVGLTSPDDVERGYSMKMVVTATGATQGLEAVELSIAYDPAKFQFVKVNSIFLEVAGNNVASVTDGSIFEIQDTSGVVRLIWAGIEPYYPPSEVIAELEFTANADADIGPAEFSYSEDSFVQTLVGRVDAAKDKLVMEITGTVEEPISDTPVPPEELVDAKGAGEPGIDVPYDSNNKVEPAGEVAGKGDEYGVDVLNEDPLPEKSATSEETPPSEPTPEASQKPQQNNVEASKPTMPSSKRPNAEKQKQDKGKVEDDKKSSLRSVMGESLFPPEDMLPVDKIPEGFQGDVKEIQGVKVPVAKNSDEDLTLYYLESTLKKPSFYTYDKESERFKPYDMKKEMPSKEVKSTFTTAEKNTETWQVLLVSLLGLTSLSVMVYTILRNLSKS